ncbi:MAG TPA: hypothetical protein VFJ71_09420 [Candidatus Limnocylindrales bacterium]|nr:hypothetical protein [Candidatus Limnocylindrales bacterium]
MRTSRGRIRLAIVAAVVVLAAGCGGTPAPSAPAASAIASAASPTGPVGAADWPAPADPMARAVQAGLKPGPKEFGVNHVHAHLDVFVDGTPVTVPAGIGINIADPAVRTFDLPDGSKEYGGIELCNDPCISPLHTHNNSGVLHTESATATPNTLGEFFVEWGVPLDLSCVSTYCSPTTKIAIYVDGDLSTGDPRAIELTDLREIAVVIGTPPATIPKTGDFSNA